MANRNLALAALLVAAGVAPAAHAAPAAPEASSKDLIRAVIRDHLNEVRVPIVVEGD